MLEEETSKTNLEVGKRGDQGGRGLRNRKNSFWRNANKKLILQLNHGFFLFFRSTAHKKEWLQSGKFLWVEESLDDYELQSVTCMSTLVDLIASLCWMIASSLKTLFTPQLMGSIPSSTSPPPSSTSISSLPLVLGRKASTSSDVVIFDLIQTIYMEKVFQIQDLEWSDQKCCDCSTPTGIEVSAQLHLRSDITNTFSRMQKAWMFPSFGFLWLSIIFARLISVYLIKFAQVNSPILLCLCMFFFQGKTESAILLLR